MQVAYQVLKQLAFGHFNSGEALAKMIHVSRARIWQAIEVLRTWGLDIYSVPGRGYRLNAPLELLDQNKIASHLYGDAISEIKHIDVFDSIDSTNDHIFQALDRGLNYSGYVVTAESQKKGRGRYGRTWASPFGQNLCTSLYWSIPKSHKQLSGLSLVVGIAVIKAIQQVCGVEHALGLKWPNDIWFQDKKLAGILVETRTNAYRSDLLDVIIGIGCNTSKVHDPELKNIATSLEEIYQLKISRNELMGHLLSEVVVSLKRFLQEGLEPFINEWKNFDLLFDQMVELHFPDQKSLTGRCLGINQTGALCVEVDKVQKTFLSSEVRVRPYATVC